MCEYCGCQQVAAIGELTREHDVDGAAKTARRIAEILQPHTAVEEHGLFPAMSEEFPEHVDALEREHRVVEAVLAEAATATPTDPTWPQRLLAALDLLRKHILKEQDGMFPASLAVLDTEGWERVEAVRRQVGSAVGPEHTAHRHDHHAHDHSHDPSHDDDHGPDQEDHA
ncbi:hemerythrin domain-containing protein [Knoellia sp. p5-6-4]|uniref:hemerythrin domain-containing protein n=1 Tax=unclassified Knoellia TaxID=2618719 RepID=UPI0023DC82C0|nr:hemerythrin domain-containing protein [Knoellia sp. p5-6-4]MDF2143414.1 hemerythrin domain-containing protein [Knoellia sp. p5-6-4]